MTTARSPRVAVPGDTGDPTPWLVRLRWYPIVAATVGLLSVSLLASQTLGPWKTFGLASVIAVLALANGVLHLLSRAGKATTRTVFVVIAHDVLLVTIALHMTGGIENPFQVYYVFPVILAGITLPRSQSYAIAGLATLLFATLGLLEYTKVLSHHDVDLLPIWRAVGPQALDQYEDVRYVAGSATVLLSTLLGATYVTTAVADRLRRHEQELSLSKERLETILRALGQGVAYFDSRGSLVLANDAFERLIPGTDGAPHFRKLLETAPALRGPLELALEAIRKGSPFESFEGEDGGRVLACGLSAVRGAGGVAWVVEDVTVRRQREARARDERRLADLGVLAAGIAHEVLNPLASIESSAQLVESEHPQARESVSMIRRHVDRITRIVRGVAELARPSARVPSPVPLEEILADAVARAREERGRREVALDLERPLPWVAVAEEPLGIAVKNLVTNALDATDAKGRVSVRARVEKDEVLIEVEDEGPGVPQAEVERIFVPFYTTKSPGRGAGLGLPIAASIARQHGGKIDVGSANGKGARFTLRLPAAAAKQPA